LPDGLRKLIGRERISAADSIRAVASVVEGDVLHQADEELGLALVLAGPIVKL
jgi:hypothetical protein